MTVQYVEYATKESRCTSHITPPPCMPYLAFIVLACCSPAAKTAPLFERSERPTAFIPSGAAWKAGELFATRGGCALDGRDRGLISFGSAEGAFAAAASNALVVL